MQAGLHFILTADPKAKHEPASKSYVLQLVLCSHPQGKPAPGTLPDPDMARLVVCHFNALIRQAPSLPPSERARAEAQIAALHPALRAACAKYAADACFPDVPLPPADNAAAPALAPGTVLVQWYQQDGCWQVPGSWYAGGTLSRPNIEAADVLALPPVETYASLLYVVVTAGGAVRAGEAAFDVASVRGVARRVRELRHRCEAPRGPTDLWGHDAPTQAELGLLRAMAERFLSRRRSSEDGGAGAAPSTDAPSTATSPEQFQVEPAARPPSPTPPAAKAAAKGGAAGGKGGKGGEQQVAAEVEQQGVPLPPTDLAFLIKLEAMLQVEGGVDMVDAGFAEWLALTLPLEAGAP